MKNIDINRIAIWSGPRNLSTALMRSFGNRTDFDVLDEPFYASFLKATGLKHPHYKEIIQSQLSDYKEVVHFCTRGDFKKPFQYQKHMVHHLPKDLNDNFIFSLNNAFLIRKPILVLSSFKKKHSKYTLKVLGYPQQLRLFRHLSKNLHYFPPVIDADDLKINPEIILKKLCAKLKINFSEEMLFWKAGPKSYDGVWGKHWYKEINQTSGFQNGPNLKSEETINFSLDDRDLLNTANAYYHELSELKISPI